MSSVEGVVVIDTSPSSVVVQGGKDMDGAVVVDESTTTTTSNNDNSNNNNSSNKEATTTMNERELLERFQAAYVESAMLMDTNNDNKYADSNDNNITDIASTTKNGEAGYTWLTSWDVIVSMIIPAILEVFVRVWFIVKAIVFVRVIPVLVMCLPSTIAWLTQQRQSHHNDEDASTSSTASGSSTASHSRIWTYVCSVLGLDGTSGGSSSHHPFHSHHHHYSYTNNQQFPPPALIVLAVLTIVALIVHPDGHLWILLRKLRSGLTFVFQSIYTCWDVVINDYGMIISTVCALATFAGLFFFAYVLRKTLQPKRPKQQQPLSKKGGGGVARTNSGSGSGSRCGSTGVGSSGPEHCDVSETSECNNKKSAPSTNSKKKKRKGKGAGQRSSGRQQQQSRGSEPSSETTRSGKSNNTTGEQVLPALLEDRPVSPPLVATSSSSPVPTDLKSHRLRTMSSASGATEDSTTAASSSVVSYNNYCEDGLLDDLSASYVDGESMSDGRSTPTSSTAAGDDRPSVVHTTGPVPSSPYSTSSSSTTTHGNQYSGSCTNSKSYKGRKQMSNNSSNARRGNKKSGNYSNQNSLSPPPTPTRWSGLKSSCQNASSTASNTHTGSRYNSSSYNGPRPSSNNQQQQHSPYYNRSHPQSSHQRNQYASSSTSGGGRGNQKYGHQHYHDRSTNNHRPTTSRFQSRKHRQQQQRQHEEPKDNRHHRTLSPSVITSQSSESVQTHESAPPPTVETSATMSLLETDAHKSSVCGTQNLPPIAYATPSHTASNAPPLCPPPGFETKAEPKTKSTDGAAAVSSLPPTYTPPSRGLTSNANDSPFGTPVSSMVSSPAAGTGNVDRSYFSASWNSKDDSTAPSWMDTSSSSFGGSGNGSSRGFNVPPGLDRSSCPPNGGRSLATKFQQQQQASVSSISSFADNDVSFLQNLSLPPGASPMVTSNVMPTRYAKSINNSNNPFMIEMQDNNNNDEEEQIEAELQELGGQMVGSILDF